MLRTIRNVLHETFLAFCKLNRIRFAAPWDPQRRGC